MKKIPELFDRGLEVRKEVLGRAYVDTSLRNATPFNEEFQTWTTQVAWGGVWTRPGLDRKTRSMLVIAMLAALGHEEELKLHIRATRNTGVSPDEVKEILLQVAAYAGVPAASSAFRNAQEAYRQMEESAKTP
jgi:4-carboxymuconolactone decarboxylase